MTITIGWRAIPFLVTVAAFASLTFAEPPRGDYSMGNGVFYFVSVLVISLAAWLVWALAT